VVLAARNEEARVEKTIRHLLGQTGVTLEVIAVDDRSSDRTGAILAALAVEDSRLRVTRVETLPQGWIGKCHACHRGAAIAQGEWILFTDADCWLAPDAIARALQAAAREGADHITAAPGFAVESVPTRAWYLLFLISILGWIAGVNRDRPKAHLGIGAFNLVRASAYQKCGGYEALRLTVVDDVKLGLLLSRGNFRTRAFLGAGDIECHWGTTLREMVRVMEKNYFAVIDYRLALVFAGTAFATIVFGTIIAGAILHTPLGIAVALSPFALILPAVIIARRMHWAAHSSLLVPFMLPVFLYALLNSTYVTLRQGGIRWRETFYPLAQLRAGGVR
jgi:glycosyltransferase involved in cell wall biosynthesis